jgi:hypothetical protein
MSFVTPIIPNMPQLPQLPQLPTLPLSGFEPGPQPLKMYLSEFVADGYSGDSWTSLRRKDRSYLELNKDKFEEAYKHFYRFQWAYGRQHQFLGVCFFAGIMLGAKATIIIDPTLRLHQFIEFSPE